MKNSRRSFISKSIMAGAGLGVVSSVAYGAEYQKAIDINPKLSAPSDLKITEVKCGYIKGGNMLFVKIYTNQGIYGCGEGVDAVGGTYHLVKKFGQRLKDQSPFNVHKIFEDIRRNGHFGGAQSGMYIAVLSAIETALWDLSGKALDLPVYQLLGGKFRDKVRVYCDTALYRVKFPSPDDFATAATDAIKNWGFNALKFDLD